MGSYHKRRFAVDSRSVQAKELFICIKGYTVDGHDFAQKAVDAEQRVIVAVKAGEC